MSLRNGNFRGRSHSGNWIDLNALIVRDFSDFYYILIVFHKCHKEIQLHCSYAVNRFGIGKTFKHVRHGNVWSVTWITLLCLYSDLRCKKFYHRVDRRMILIADLCDCHECVLSTGSASALHMDIFQNCDLLLYVDGLIVYFALETCQGWSIKGPASIMFFGFIH